MFTDTLVSNWIPSSPPTQKNTIADACSSHTVLYCINSSGSSIKSQNIQQVSQTGVFIW